MRIPFLPLLAAWRANPSPPHTQPIQCGNNSTLGLAIHLGDANVQTSGCARGFVIDAWLRKEHSTYALICDRPAQSPLWRCGDSLNYSKQLYALIQPTDASFAAHVYFYDARDRLYASTTLDCETVSP